MSTVELKKLRKIQDILKISGTAVIVFGIWSIFKAVISFVLGTDTNIDFGLDAFKEMDSVLDIFVLAIVLIFMVLDLILRLYVGLSAGAESRGKNKGAAYIVIAIILTLLSMTGIAGIFLRKMNVPDMIVSLFIEMTSLYAFIELIVSAIILKRYRKILKKAG